MKLFETIIDDTQNLLPKDGIVNYYGKVLTKLDADAFLNVLLNTISWENDQAVIFGKHLTTKRKVSWYGDKAFEYTYSGKTKNALPFTPNLSKLKQLVEQKTGETFNSCLCNLYHDGNEGMGWHSDAEKDLKKDGAIASLSFGTERKFAFKHKIIKEKREFLLEHGSLLVMTGTTQTHWLHRLPPTKKIHSPRVNLTFRTIVEKN